MLGSPLSRTALQEWSRRIERQGSAFTVQGHLPLSQMPTWHGKRQRHPIVPCSTMLRVFAVCDGPQSWRVLPGGLARIAAEGHGIASMQRGGSSADVWALTDGPVDATTLLPHQQSGPAVAQRSRQVASRAAENLFWLGRYTERTENTTRLARLALQCLSGEGQTSRPLLAWIGAMATQHGMLPKDTTPAPQARRAFERALIAGLADTAHATGVGFNLRGLRGAAACVRERLSQEHWSLIVRAEAEFFQHLGARGSEGEDVLEALRVLKTLSSHTAAMTGAQTDRMTRDDGWRLLSIGRHLERLGFLADALARAIETGAVFEAGGFEAVVALFDSTITFHAQYQLRRDMPALLDLLVIDHDNPRALAWVAQTLRGRIAKIEEAAGADARPLVQGIPMPPPLTVLCAQDNGHAALRAYLRQCVAGAWQLSDLLATRYFTHSAGTLPHSLGA